MFLIAIFLSEKSLIIIYLHEKPNHAMKTILTIILAVGIQISALIAGTIGEQITPMNPVSFFCPECPILIPKVPLEAPFTEITNFNIPVSLVPSVPLEATFEDNSDVTELVNITDLTPVVPDSADFSEEL